MAPMYVLVEELDKNHTSVAIRLRAVRTYNVWHSRGRDQIKSRECVFHDEAGSYIHLHIPGKSVSPKNDFVEGNVYCIKNFLLVAHWYMYRLKAFEVLNTLDANILVAGEVKICSSYDATKLLFNENTLEFVEFRNSLSMQQQTPFKSITSNSTFSYGTTSGVESSTKMHITTLSEIFSKREADELKAMQPSVMTKVPKDIRNLKGRASPPQVGGWLLHVSVPPSSGTAFSSNVTSSTRGWSPQSINGDVTYIKARVITVITSGVSCTEPSITLIQGWCSILLQVAFHPPAKPAPHSPPSNPTVNHPRSQCPPASEAAVHHLRARSHPPRGARPSPLRRCVQCVVTSLSNLHLLKATLLSKQPVHLQ
nr:replication protein A 70 kDa DNA-binding subunit B-like [Ipomoea batatas]